jgi:plastocyanin
MRLRTAVIGTIALAALAGCGGYTASGPYGGGGGGGGGNGGGGGGGGGGPVGSVTVGNNGRIAFISAHNGTANPAVDTVAAGATVTWTWTNNEGFSHSVQSQGSTAFASSPIMDGDGQTYAVTFSTPGTYQYDCAVHGTAMSGTIVVR